MNTLKHREGGSAGDHLGAVRLKTGWRTKMLSEVCEMYQPKTISGKEMVEDGPFLVYGANGVIGRYNQFNHEEPQLLITCRGATCGSVNISAPRSWINGNAMVVRPRNDELGMRYLEYLFLGGIDLSKAITGTAQPQITRSNLEPLNISFPESLAEQQRIVAILDEAFEGIATARANAVKNLENARALFESHLEAVLLSKKWTWKNLGEVCDRVEYGSSAKSKATGRVPVLRMGNIQNGQINWDSLVYTDDLNEISKYSLNHNDVLFNRTNSPELVGKTAIYKSEMPAVFAGYLIRIHRKANLLDGDYLNYFLNSRFALDYGKTVFISSVNQANINGSKLMGYPIPIPNIAEQQVIVTKLDALSDETNRLTDIYTQKIAALDALKKSLLHQAFSGAL